MSQTKHLKPNLYILSLGNVSAEGDTCARMAVLEEKVCEMERDNSVFRMEVEKRLAELEKKISTAQINHPDETNTNVSLTLSSKDTNLNVSVRVGAY